MGGARFLERLKRINRFVALLIGFVLLGCVIFICAEILLRQFGTSLGGTDEVSGYVMAVTTSWGMAYALLELAHVRIDVIRGRLGESGRVMLDLLSMIVLNATAVTIALYCWPVLERSLVNGSRANTSLETPLAWVQAPWFAGWVWFAVISCLMTLVALAEIARGRLGSAEAAIGLLDETAALSKEPAE